MPPKKSNGFMTFVQEWRSNNSQGRNMTIPQAVSHCGEIWKNMNAQERGPYNSKAKNADVLSRVKTERMNSCGQAISAVEQEERKGAEQQMQMKLGIERMVLDGKKQYDLENTKFVFAAFNYFAKTNSNGIYIPAEFAACLFSLKSGKTSIYSSLINPGHIIFGQSSESQHHAQTTHQLPLPPNALGESDMGRLYSNILEYLRSCQIDENPHGPLVVFTSSDLMPVVKGCFRYLSCDMESKAEQIYVYDIQYLFFVLKKEVMELADLSHNNINKSITDALFLNDHFEYHSGLSCQFHEDHDRSKYCVQSLVTRWSYIFSDYMCGDLAIKPLLGKHMPPKQECKFKVVNPKLDESSANNSFASCSSFQSEVKTEHHRKFVPTDHTAFSASINNTAEFPSLGGRKSRVVRQPLSTNFPGRAPKNDWNVPASNLSAKDIEDAFNMNALV